MLCQELTNDVHTLQMKGCVPLFHRGGGEVQAGGCPATGLGESRGEREEPSLLLVPLFPRGVPAVQGVVRVKSGREGKILSTQ